MRIIKKTIPITPVSASRPRVARGRVFYKEAYEEFRNDFDKWLTTQKRDQITGMVEVYLEFYIAMPKSFSKKKASELDGEYCDKNLDIDNLEKAVYDKISNFFIEDDRYIVRNANVKKWSSNPRIEMEISTV